ncbi:MAG: hypothetical protein D6730_22410 [Bacteroidetes bacterium]|nr:MAG: hypothetical protein D6730_22410 [Bacteroidota bacterium]
MGTYKACICGILVLFAFLFNQNQGYGQSAEATAQRWLVKYTSQRNSNFAMEHKVPDLQGVRVLRLGASQQIQLWEFSSTEQAESQWLDQVLAEKQKYGIEWIEKDVEFRHAVTPSDSHFDKQWYLQNTGQFGPASIADIQATKAWQFTQGSEEVVVGVIDSGIDWRHPDLAENIWQNLGEDLDGDGHVLELINGVWQFDPDDEDGLDTDGNGYADDFIGWDFVNNDNDPSDDHIFGHGTHVAGIIAARGNNGLGISGVSWRSKLMPLKFLNAQGRGFASGAIEALDYAKRMDVKITNNSWGGGAFSQAVQEAINEFGGVFVAAAGNHFANNNDQRPLFPSSYALPNIIAVAATDGHDRLANFSNYGATSVDICAPGVAIYSTLPAGRYGFLNGTSMAAPQITGALCLLLSDQPGLSVSYLKDRIMQAVDQPATLAGSCVSEGRINLLKLLNKPTAFNATILDSQPMVAQDITSALNQQYSIAGATDSGFVWTRLSGEGEINVSQYYTADDVLRINQILQMPDGNTLGCGWVKGPGGMHALLLKLNDDGNVLWAFRLEGSGSDQFDQILLDDTPAANIYLAGKTTGFGVPHASYLLCKIDQHANPIWQKVYTPPDTLLHLGQLARLNDGNILLSANLGNEAQASLHLLKVDTLGQLNGEAGIQLPGTSYSQPFGLKPRTKILGAKTLPVNQLIAVSKKGSDDGGNGDDHEEDGDEGDDDGDDEEDEPQGVVPEITTEMITESYWLAAYSKETAGKYIVLLELDTQLAVITAQKILVPGLKPGLDMEVDQDNGLLIAGLQGDSLASLLLFRQDAEGRINWAKEYPKNLANEKVMTFFSPELGLLTLGSLMEMGNHTAWHLVKTQFDGSIGCDETDFPLQAPQVFVPQVLPLQSQQLSPGGSMLPLSVRKTDRLLQSELNCTNDACETAAIFIPSALKTCPGGSIFFENQSNGATEFEWWVDGSFVARSLHLEHTFDRPGRHKVMLVASRLSCSSIIEQTIWVDDLPSLNLKDTTLCAPAILLDGGRPGLAYKWLKLVEHGKSELLDTTRVIKITESGSYKLEAEDACANQVESKFEVVLNGDCVWPGDVNTDGYVDIIDFISLGVVQGRQGPARPQASSEYAAQEAPDWQQYFPPTHRWAAGLDLKYADCDGNGQIDLLADGQVIRQNASQRLRQTAGPGSGTVSISLQSPQDVIQNGDTLFFDVVLSGLNDNYIQHVHSLAFELSYNLPLSHPPFLQSENSWLGSDGTQLASISLLNPQRQSIQHGLVRYSSTAINGRGPASRGGVVVIIADLGDFDGQVEQTFFSMAINQAVLLDEQGREIPVNNLGAQSTLTVAVEPKQIALDLRAWLQGAYEPESGTMRTDLNQQGVLPYSQPYTSAPREYVAAFAPDVVDWVLVELRAKEQPASVVASRAGLLLRNGKVVDPQSYDFLHFNVSAGSYYVVLKHRNHLPAFSNEPVKLSESGLLKYDFTNPRNKSDGMVEVAQGCALMAGDINQDGKVSLSGPGNDRREILLQLGTLNLTRTVEGYFSADVNLDGKLQYRGAYSDELSLRKALDSDNPTRIIYAPVPRKN